MSKLYAAYDTNINKWLMQFTCNTAKFIGSGRIEGYELQFRGARRGAAPTIVPKEGSFVCVGVWEIQKEDEKRLNRHKGFPGYYAKQRLPVQMEGKTVQAMTYVMEQKHMHCFGEPAISVLQLMQEGYRDCGHDTALLDQALQNSIAQAKPCMETQSGMQML